jgi:hypothetical protein
MKKINNIYVENFEKILEKSIVIEYNENQIEIPGIIIFTKKSTQTLISRLFNPSIEIVSVDDESFEMMINSAKVYEIEGKKFAVTSKTKPIKTIIFNIKNLESQIVFAKKENNIIIVNDFLFTTKEFDFHGESIFTSRKVFFIDQEYFNLIDNYIFKNLN